MSSDRSQTPRPRKEAFGGVAMAAALCLGLAAALPVEAQDLDWAKRAGGTNDDRGLGIARDAAGNSYMTGLFTGTATFGPGEANETMLTSAGSNDISVAKYDASGALVWAKRAGGASGDMGEGIATDGAGNSYVTGTFAGTATFGPGEANQTTLNSTAASADIFLAKYDASGALVWAKRAGGSSGDQGSGVATDGADNSYVTGHFQGTATFGPGEVNQTTLTSAGGPDLFVAKYDASGDLVWAKRAGGGNGDQGSAIATDGAGNSYTTGLFQVSATFGFGEANETTLTSSGNNIFVAKYDSSGDLAWAKTTSGATGGGGHGIATDGAGHSYVTGDFSGAATFGAGEPNQTTLTSAAKVTSSSPSTMQAALWHGPSVRAERAPTKAQES